MTEAVESFLYPALSPFAQGWLEVGDGHEIFWQQFGKQDGESVLFVHGGPGRPWSPATPRLFDPAHYRLITFDQRGSWRSRPLGALEANTTEHLVGDMEVLRAFLGVERWHLFGGSWGSCLALCYAIAHSDRIASMVLWGIYLGLRSENVWVNETARWLRPAACDALQAYVGEINAQALLEAYQKLINDPDPSIHDPAIEVYEAHQDALSNIQRYDEALARLPPTKDEQLAELRIALAYYTQGCFLPEGYILQHAEQLKGLSGLIIHGAEDLLCPLSSAHDLAAAWQGSRLTVVPGAGHFAFEPGIARAILEEFERLKGAVSY